MRVVIVLGLAAACGSSPGHGGDAGPTRADGAPDGAASAPPDASRECTPVAAGTFEHYGLPPTTGLPPSVSFVSDWTQHPIAGGFDGKQAVDDCRMKPDGFATWHGKPAVRVEVDPGDDPLHLGTERAELLSMQDASGTNFDAEGASGATLYYATSYYFPSTWDGTFLQGDSNSWSFVNQFYGWTGLSAGRHHAADAQVYGFDDHTFTDGGHVTLGRWTDFVFQIDWATGAYVVYRRDEGQTKFAAVLSASSTSTGSCQYYKQGLYRGPDVNGRTDVLWIGPTARGTSFAAVELASFGTSDGF
jgi:hypothetical protein